MGVEVVVVVVEVRGGGVQLTEESKLPGESFRQSRLQKVGR